jgi:hypothetical protein
MMMTLWSRTTVVLGAHAFLHVIQTVYRGIGKSRRPARPRLADCPRTHPSTQKAARIGHTPRQASVAVMLVASDIYEVSGLLP